MDSVSGQGLLPRFLPYPQVAEKEIISIVSLIKTLISVVKAPPSLPNYVSKAPLPSTSRIDD